MPRFFFDLRLDGEYTRISVAELDDRAMAREYAIGLAQSLLGQISDTDKTHRNSIVYGDQGDHHGAAMEQFPLVGVETYDEE